MTDEIEQAGTPDGHKSEGDKSADGEGVKGTAQANEVAAAFSDLVVTALSGVPAAFKRIVWDTIGKLVTKTSDLGGVYLDTLGEERRAASAQRIKIMGAVGDQLQGGVSISESHAQAATQAALRKILGKQHNVDQTCVVALQELAKNGSQLQAGNAPGVVSEDWINAFDSEAGNAATESMRLHFGKILAGEIQRPGSFSIRTLKLMGQLDNRVAAFFTLLCSIAVAQRDVRSGYVLNVQALDLGQDADREGMARYGLDFQWLNLLIEYGLVVPKLNAVNDYRGCVGSKAWSHFVLGGTAYTLTPQGKETEHTRPEFTGVTFTNAGKELFPIVPISPDAKYLLDLKAMFASRRYELTPV